MTKAATSPRRDELLDRAYGYVLEHGLGQMSLRPLAAAVGSSPRVMLFLFGSKHELLRALLARARADELEALDHLKGGGSVHDVGRKLWEWLRAPAHRPLLVLWLEAYSRSLVEPDGPWAGFAQETVEDWLTLLAAAQPPSRRRTIAGRTERTLTLALLRGSLLDLLATGDAARITAAVNTALTP